MVALTKPPVPPKGHGGHETITIEGEGLASQAPRGFRFGRMFPASAYHALILKLQTCSDIGERMTAMPEQSRGDSDLPAGYTYLGQFIDHDISFDGTDNPDSNKEHDDPTTEAVEATPVKDLVQERSPTLDLDSLYGSPQTRDDALFEGPRFKIGSTTPTPGAGVGHVQKSLPYDLPRSDLTRQGSVARKALIGDPRNDENLAVAQTHLMWLKFHNAIVDRLQIVHPGASTGVVFEMARDLVTKHYQYIVLHDFVARYVQPSVFDDVIIKGKRKILQHGPGEVAFMPIEFSVAAYRHGHSQVREEYDWNVNFGPAGAVFRSPFQLLFQFSQLSGDLGGNPTLPTNWIADFRRLYDFGDMAFPHLAGSTTGTLNLTKKIDPYLASALGSLPEVERLVQMGLRPFANLAGLNLRRGSMRGLPSGQDVSRCLYDVKMLTKAQINKVIDEDFQAAMTQHGLYERTPLWLYLLLEAAATEDGLRLGEMGSIITAETFLTLIITSRSSILKPGAEWTPDDAKETLGADISLTTMPAILKWIDDRDPIIDPLQDARLA